MPISEQVLRAMLHAARKIADIEASDAVLAKDFLALYTAARAVTTAWHPSVERDALSHDVGWLGEHVRRLAPLYDDVRRTLATPPRMVLANGDYPINPAHTVNVLQDDGSTRVECDHKFLGLHGNRCVHCGKPAAKLRAEESARAADIERRAREPGVDVVSIALGPTLRARVDKLVKTRRLGSTLAHVAQTLFVLGLLDAEGQDPRAHVGEPSTHFAVDAVFVSFALSHELGDESRRDTLRSLFAWLHAWLGDDERLQPAAAAALEALPRT